MSGEAKMNGKYLRLVPISAPETVIDNVTEISRACSVFLRRRGAMQDCGQDSPDRLNWYRRGSTKGART